MRFRATRLAGALAMGWLCACGSDGSSSSNPDGGPADGGPIGDGSIVVPDGPIDFHERALGIGDHGFVMGAGKRLVSLPDALSTKLESITMAKLDGVKVAFAMLPVTGVLPNGRIEAITYDAFADRLVMVVRAQRPHRIEVVTLEVSDTSAKFTTLTQSKVIAADGFMFNALHARGGGAFLAPRGNDLQPFTISGTTLTWEATTPAGSFLQTLGVATANAFGEGGLYAFGKLTYDPVLKKMVLTPTVQKNVPVGPSWSDVPMGGQPPEVDNTNPNPVAGWIAYDAKGKRLFISSLHEILPCPLPNQKCMAPGLWIADLKSSSWSKGPDSFSNGYSMGPWATDDEGRRALDITGGRLSAMALDEKTNFTYAPLTQSGDPGPRGADAAAMAPNGTILDWDSGGFRALDTKNALSTWTAADPKLVPDEIRYDDTRTVVWDDQNGDWLVTTARGGLSKSISTYVVSAGLVSMTKLDATGAPPPRFGAGAISASGTTYLVGGSVSAGGAAVDEVWALDRKAKTWKQLGKLPRALMRVTVRRVGPTELLVLGSEPTSSGEALAPPVSIDLGSGTAKELPVHGDPGPTMLWATAPLGTGFVGYESGDTVDATQPNLWTLTRDADGVAWKKTAFDADDYSLNGSRGVGAGDGTAVFVGRHLWVAKITK